MQGAFNLNNSAVKALRVWVQMSWRWFKYGPDKYAVLSHCYFSEGFPSGSLYQKLICTGFPPMKVTDYSSSSDESESSDEDGETVGHDGTVAVSDIPRIMWVALSIFLFFSFLLCLCFI